MAYAQRTVDNAPDKVRPGSVTPHPCLCMHVPVPVIGPVTPCNCWDPCPSWLQAASLTNCAYLAPDDPLARAQFLEIGAL